MSLLFTIGIVDINCGNGEWKLLVIKYHFIAKHCVTCKIYNLRPIPPLGALRNRLDAKADLAWREHLLQSLKRWSVPRLGAHKRWQKIIIFNVQLSSYNWKSLRTKYCHMNWKASELPSAEWKTHYATHIHNIHNCERCVESKPRGRLLLTIGSQFSPVFLNLFQTFHGYRTNLYLYLYLWKIISVIFSLLQCFLS